MFFSKALAWDQVIKVHVKCIVSKPSLIITAAERECAVDCNKGCDKVWQNNIDVDIMWPSCMP